MHHLGANKRVSAGFVEAVTLMRRASGQYADRLSGFLQRPSIFRCAQPHARATSRQEKSEPPAADGGGDAARFSVRVIRPSPEPSLHPASASNFRFAEALVGFLRLRQRPPPAI